MAARQIVPKLHVEQDGAKVLIQGNFDGLQLLSLTLAEMLGKQYKEAHAGLQGSLELTLILGGGHGTGTDEKAGGHAT